MCIYVCYINNWLASMGRGTGGGGTGARCPLTFVKIKKIYPFFIRSVPFGNFDTAVIYTCSHVKYINYTCSNYTKLKNASSAASFQTWGGGEGGKRHKIYFIQSVVGSALFWRCPPTF